MDKKRVLYVCQEIVPYLPETPLALSARELLAAMYERGMEIRTFMPKYGCVNERRNQLHEVIRLSGMNIIIGDNDHQLIIKVASLPSVRVQVYFIDNDDYFSRKAVLQDETGADFADNDERAIFFARGVIETVKKLQWKPDVVHCHGWFSAIVPVYIKNMFADDPLFADTKIVMSIDNSFEGELNADFKDKMVKEGASAKHIASLTEPTYNNLIEYVLRYIDGVIVETSQIDKDIEKMLKESNKKVLWYEDPQAEGYYDNYRKFYDELF